MIEKEPRTHQEGLDKPGLLKGSGIRSAILIPYTCLAKPGLLTYLDCACGMMRASASKSCTATAITAIAWGHKQAVFWHVFCLRCLVDPAHWLPCRMFVSPLQMRTPQSIAVTSQQRTVLSPETCILLPYRAHMKEPPCLRSQAAICLGVETCSESDQGPADRTASLK